MTGLCSAAGESAGFIGSLTSFIDCQAQTLGTGAWSAHAMPGSTLMVVLTGFVTIFIALIGYNLLLGTSLTVRSATLAFVKIGTVFALTTSWPAYREVIYDLVVDGPGQLVGEIGSQAGAVGADGTLLARLDLTDRALVQLAILGTGPLPANAGMQVAPPPFGGFDAFALGGSRILFLLTAIAGLTAARLVAGLMLAIGPFFIAFLLFDSTRSLFEGWVRVLAGAALASVGASLVLGLELALMEPWLNGILARRAAGESLPAMPTDLFVLTILFAIFVLAALYSCARLASVFRLPAKLRIMWVPAAAQPSSRNNAADTRRPSARANESERGRTAAMTSMFARFDARDIAYAARASDGSRQGGMPDLSQPSREAGRTGVPLGRSFNRRSSSRLSARAAKRDAGA
jgi:type IV secretion system protein VirB6